MPGLATFQFDTSVFEAVGCDRVTMNGPTLFACNINIHAGQSALSFETWGKHYYYVVSVSSSKVEIEVWELRVTRRLSVMQPRNQSELLMALDTIGADFEDWYDARFAA